MNKVYFVVEEVLKSSGKKKYKVLRLEERPSGKIKKIRLGTLDSENDAREVVTEFLDECPEERLISDRKLRWYLDRKKKKNIESSKYIIM